MADVSLGEHASLIEVLDFLAGYRFRATFKAVGDAVGVYHRALRYRHPFKAVDPRTGWVVYAKTGQPPPRKHHPRPTDTVLIATGADLVRQMRSTQLDSADRKNA